MTKFETVFLQAKSCVSQWDARMSMSLLSNSDGEDLIILPPLKPSALKICIKCYDNSSVFNRTKLEELGVALQNGISFWEDQLFYDVALISNDDSSIVMDLKCKIWSIEKMVALLEKPISLRTHLRSPKIVFLERLELQSKFHHSLNSELSTNEVIAQFNEYLSSLIVSQLEFQCPMVFSMTSRRKFLSQSIDLGPLSYSLSCSSSLLPNLVKLIANDNTGTTIYRLLNATGKASKKEHSNFQILR